MPLECVRVLNGIGDTRAVRRKHRTQFQSFVMGELLRLAGGEDLYVNLTWPDKRVIATNKGKHPAIGRKRRRSYRVRKLGELNPLGGVRRANWAPQPEGYSTDDYRYRRRGDDWNSPAATAMLCLLDCSAGVCDLRQPALCIFLHALAQQLANFQGSFCWKSLPVGLAFQHRRNRIPQGLPLAGAFAR